MQIQSTVFLAVIVLSCSVATADDFKPDPGFTPLFHASDLTGWKQTRGGESLDGKTEAYGKRFTFSQRTLHIDPKIKGDVHIETQRVMPRDVHMKLEFKGDAGCNNDLFLHGMKFDLSKANIPAFQADTWQTLEITTKGDKAEFKLDGKPVKTLKTKGLPTSFRIRAEFGTIAIRKLQMAEIK